MADLHSKKCMATETRYSFLTMGKIFRAAESLAKTSTETSTSESDKKVKQLEEGKLSSPGFIFQNLT